jgi:sugar lactone lactonase YvrE
VSAGRHSKRGELKLEANSDRWAGRRRRLLRATAVLAVSAVPFVGTLIGADAAGAISPSSYQSQTTIGTGLNHPDGVAVDAAGDVFIADTRNSRVVEVPANGGPQVTVGTGIQFPQGVTVDSAGNVYIAESGNNLVVKVNVRTGAQTTIDSGLSNPTSVAVDPAGNVYIANTNAGQVIELPVTGGSKVVMSALSAPFGVATDFRGDVFIADSGANQVFERGSGSSAFTSIGSNLSFPTGVAVDLAGDTFIANYGGNDVYELPAGGGPEATIGTGFQAPQGVAVSLQGTVYVADQNNNQVVELAAPTTMVALPGLRLGDGIYSAIVVSSVDYLPIAGQTVTFSVTNPKTGNVQAECSAVTNVLGIAYCFGTTQLPSGVQSYMATSTGSAAYQSTSDTAGLL